MSQVLSCPTTDELERFLLGQVADADADGLERHLDECGKCRAALVAINVDDPIVLAAQAMRTEESSGLADGHGATHGEEVEQLIERLSRLIGPGGDVTQASRHAATPAEAESTHEIYDFLSPPEGPGEIGRLGPYRVLRLLGAGGMGVVFQAEDTNLHRPVAIKAIRPALAATSSARRRFVREARAIAGLEHENIVKILHVGEDRGVPYLAMPFLPGETLEDRLAREGRLPIAAVLEIGRQIAAGLAAAHDRELVHRDVKPSNIWLERSRHAPRDESGWPNGADLPNDADSTNDARSEVRFPHAEREGYIAEREEYVVKLLDFGLVRAVGGEEQTTHSSVIVGTPAYMAPEQAEGAAVDPRTDLFSLGCVLYRMCTGRAPFAEATTLKTLLALAKGRARRPSEFNPEVPPALEDLVMKLLSRRAADRLASAREVAAELQAIAAGRVHSRRRRVTRRATFAAIIALVFVAGFVGYWTDWSFSWGRSPLAEREGYGSGDGEAEAAGLAPVFEPAVNYACGLYPSQAVAADFNRDGRIDVAVANLQSHAISVLPGAGDGTFGSPVVAAAGEWFASAMTPGDLNSDGKLDFVVVNGGSHQISSILGNGDGTFQPPVQFGVGQSPVSAAIGDWNRDGKPDVAVSDGNGISILIGNGDGRFQSAAIVAVGVPTLAVAAADLDRDGQLDLAVAIESDSALAVLLGKGDGSFQPPLFAGDAGKAEQLVVADFDEDGILDVVLGGTGAARVLIGEGDGNFHEGSRFTDEAIGHVATADLDADGHIDLAVVERSDVSLRFYFGNGDGSFRAGPNHRVGGAPRIMGVGDFNGDGAPDLAVPNHHSNDLSILLSRGAAPYRSMLGPAIHLPVGRSPSGVATSDFNFDGRLDLAVTNAGDDTVSILSSHHAPRDEGGSPTHSQNDNDALFADASRAIRSHHAERDGYSSERDGIVGLKLERTLKTGKTPSAVAVGDLNRDGRPDLVVAARGDDAVHVLLGTGAGANFESGGSFATERGPTSLALGDFNRDGRLDAVAANYDAGSVSVLVGAGDGTFQPAANLPAGSKPSFVIAADWNRDGTLDLAVANYAQVGASRVMLGNGDGTFRDPVTLPAGSYPRSLVADDFDRDGRLDLMVGNWGLGDTNVFLGRGDGTFGNPSTFTFGGQGFGLTSSDFDGDGRVDFAGTDWLSHRVGIQRGDGDGRFRNGGMFSVGLRPVAVLAGRFNRDARPDLVVVNSDSDTISILANRSAAPYLSAGPGYNGIVGVPHRFSVYSFDADHSSVELPAKALRFSSSDPRAELPDERWADTAKDAVLHQFFVTLHTPGIQTVTVETADGAILASSAVTRVFQFDELHFDFDSPTAVTAGTPFSLTVYASDPTGRNVASYPGTIRFSSSDPLAKLPPTFQIEGEVGSHTFTNEFILNTPGEQTITVTDTAHPSLTGSMKITVK